MRVLRRALRIVAFLGYYFRELVISNLWVAWEVATPRYNMRPAIVRVPVRARTDLQITLLANAISFTPGTLSLEVAADRKAIYVHGLHVSTAEDFRARIGRLEDRLLRAFDGGRDE